MMRVGEARAGERRAHRLFTSPALSQLEPRLLAELAERLGEGRRAIVVLPTRDLARRLRAALLARGLSDERLRLHTFGVFAQRLAGIERLDPTPAAARATVRAALAELPARSPLAGWTGHAGVQAAVAGTLLALRDGGFVDGARFAEAVGALDDAPARLRDLAAVYAAVGRAGAGWEGRRRVLAGAARFRGRFSADTLYLYGFDALTPFAQAVIGAVAEDAALVAYVPFGEERFFSGVRPFVAWLQAIGCAASGGATVGDEGRGPAADNLTRLQQGWPRLGDGEAAAGDGSLTVRSAPNPVREVREAAREVLAALRRGLPADEIAVLYRRHESYGRLVAETLERLDVPAYLTRGAAVAQTPAGAAVRRLLRLAGSRYRRAEVMELITGAPLRLPAGAVAARWDRLSRTAGVVRGRGHWDERPRRLAATLLDAAAGEEDEARAAALSEEAEAAAQLRAYVLALIERLEGLSGRAAWAIHVERARALAEALLEAGEAEDVLEALDGLAALDAVEGEVEWATFREAALARLAEAGEAGGELGDGVFCGEVGVAIGLRFRLVCVLGVAEGDFPLAGGEDPLLPDDERRRLGLPPAAAETEREPARFRALLDLATERLVLSWARADPGGTRPRLPSYYLLKAGETLLGRRLTYGEVEHIPGFERLSAARSAADDPGEALDAGEAELARIERGLRGGQTVAEAALDSGAGEEFVERAGRVAERWTGRRFGLLDGVFAGEAALAAIGRRADPARRALSPTAIETYARCPHRYLLERVLHLERAVEPDLIEQVERRDRGGIMHAALQAFYEEMLAAGELPLRAGRLPYYRERMLAALDARCAEEERRGRTGYALLWAVDRAGMADDLLETLDEDVKRAGDGFVPAYFELSFGLGGEPPAAYALADGRTLRFRGFIDRVDRHADGRLRVIDYKTGAPTPTTPNLLTKGTRMQPPVYLLAAAARFGVGRELLAAELYYSSRKGNFRRATFEGRALADRAADLEHIFATVADGIALGRFHPHPGENRDNCRFCDFRRVCDSRVDQLWSAKRGDPESAGFVALSEIK